MIRLFFVYFAGAAAGDSIEGRSTVALEIVLDLKKRNALRDNADKTCRALRTLPIGSNAASGEISGRLCASRLCPNRQRWKDPKRPKRPVVGRNTKRQRGGWRFVLIRSGLIYRFCFRLNAKTPIKPPPSKSNVVGSGTYTN